MRAVGFCKLISNLAMDGTPNSVLFPYARYPVMLDKRAKHYFCAPVLCTDFPVQNPQKNLRNRIKPIKNNGLNSILDSSNMLARMLLYRMSVNQVIQPG